MNNKFLEKVRQLPIKQQIALWVILKHFNRREGTRFTVPEFAEKSKKYLLSDNSKELSRIMGGMLSSLYRNKMIQQFTGGRQPVWEVVPELHKNAKQYRDAMFPVVTYWEKEKK